MFEDLDASCEASAEDADAVYDTRCGFVAIVGRPNVGKSTLLNAILGQKVSITSYKPQTTRHQILGIKTTDKTQIVYVDTPGIHQGAHKALNRQMNKVAHQALLDVNAVIFVIEALKWTQEDEKVARVLQEHGAPLMIAINKIDLIKEKSQLLAFMQEIHEKLPKAEMIPLSAKKKQQIDTIVTWVDKHIPMSPFYFPEDQLFNHTERFHLSEIIREKLMRQLAQELPYSIDVQIEALEHQEKIIHIHGLIYAEREGQKPIIVGKQGAMLREIGTKARQEMERFYGKKVCLKLWVKIKEGWSDNKLALQEMGYVQS
ncbi:GTPase Era [Candidatus Berkiella aquae]|nr:GTPase Era [Candidatus Berkiella aquae]